MDSRVALITFLDGGGGVPGHDLPSGPVYPSHGLPGGPVYPSHGLPGGGYPSHGLPGGPGRPVQLPVWPFDPIVNPTPPPDTKPIEPGQKFVLKCTVAFGLILVPDAEPK